jgi:hypothetical protein
MFSDGTEYRKATAAEFVMLNMSVNDATAEVAARDALRRWLDARRHRVNTFHEAFKQSGGGRDLADVDMTWTSLEGTASYVEQQYLRTIEVFTDPLLAADLHARQNPSSDVEDLPFHQMAVERAAKHGYVENYFYAVGELVCRLLDRADPSWKSQIFERPNLLIGAVEAAIQ